MDSKPVKNEGAAPRKIKFAPKAPPIRKPKPSVVKTELRDDKEDAEAAKAKDLLRRFNEGVLKERPKAERKVAPTQIAFGYGGAATSTKSFRQRRDQSDDSSRGFSLREDYKDPWDYYSYYPVTLPLRRPHSGNPELLDEEEFGEASTDVAYNEGAVNSAAELGLLDDWKKENPEASMFLLQLPPSIPRAKQSTTAESNVKAESSVSPGVPVTLEKSCSLNEVPAGFMGKMLVYRSGGVKLKLGGTLYDVSSGSDCVFAQDVVAVNDVEKHFCVVGELSKRAIIYPDMDSILDGTNDL